jgi:hypothetical protein
LNIVLDSKIFRSWNFLIMLVILIFFFLPCYEWGFGKISEESFNIERRKYK